MATSLRKRSFLVVRGGGLGASIALHKRLGNASVRRRELLTEDEAPLLAALECGTPCDVVFLFGGACPPTDVASLAERIVGLGGTLELRALAGASLPVVRIAIVAREAGLGLDNELATIARHAKGGLTVFGRSVPRTWPVPLQAWVVCANPSEVPRGPVAGVNLAKLTHVYASEAFLGTKPVLSKQFLRRILVNSLCEFWTVTRELGLTPYAPLASKSSKALFVFPARMLPANRAFLARGFDLITHLNVSGRHTDVLVFGPANRDAQRIRAALGAIAPKAFEAPLQRGAPSGFMAGLAAKEEELRGMLGLSGAPPSSFANREHAINVEANVEKVVETALEGRYRVVILTGAWFSQPVARLRRALPGIRIICDTHDVFFVVDRDVNRDSRRVLHSAQREKQREVRRLNSFDAVIAISAADAENMRAAGVRVPVLTAPGSFEYALLKPPTAKRVGHFGYIGTSNTQNRLALDLLAREWWPEILSVMPDSTLHLAGPICDVPAALRLRGKYQAAVVLHGRVPSLSDFYRQVHTVLAPIVVQGGLNFKSVEALMGGRNLVCTELGARCLGSDARGVWVVRKPGDVAKAIEKIASPQTQTEVGLEIQRAAHRRFGETSGYAELDSWLDENS